MFRLVSAWVLVNGLLMTPVWLSGAVADGPITAWLSLEAAMIVGTMALLPRRPWGRARAGILAAGAILCAVVSLADVVMRLSLGRPLNLSLDLYLLNAVYRLAVGNSGFLRTLLAMAAMGASLALCATAAAWLLTPAASDRAEPRPRLVPRLGGVVLVAALALGFVGRSSPAVGDRLATPGLGLVLAQAELFRATRTEREAFAAELERRPDGLADLPDLLSRLEGRNVVLTFIESYGMAALEDPEFAAIIRPRLQEAEARIERAGLHMASGELASPTLGGQSW